jgi:hypothetical protein
VALTRLSAPTGPVRGHEHRGVGDGTELVVAKRPRHERQRGQGEGGEQADPGDRAQDGMGASQAEDCEQVGDDLE